MLDNHICALDIGSSKIAACLAQVRKKKITQLFFETMALRCVKAGSVVDAVALVNGVSSVLKSLKARSGIRVKNVYTGISGRDISTKHSRAVIPLAERGNKIITATDIQKVCGQALVLGASLEEETIHHMPFSYTIDGQSGIANPLGLYSHKLEVDLYLIGSRLSGLQARSHAIQQAGYEVKDIFFSGLATAEAVSDAGSTRGVTVLCDIGSDTTELLIFKDGLLKHVEISQQGGDDLTAKLADTLKVPLDFAEDIKKSYGAIGEALSIKEDKEILIKKDSVYKPISQRLVAEIVTAGAKALCESIKAAIEKNIACTQVNQVLVCGRTILQEGFLEMLEAALSTRTLAGRLLNPGLSGLANGYDALAGQKYLAYSTALGMLCLALREYQPPALFHDHPSRNPVLKTLHRVRDIYQEYF